MNKVRRAQLAKAIELLADARLIIDEVMEEEQEAFDNMPEGIQSSFRGEQMEEFIYMMEEAIDNLEEMESTIQDEIIEA